MFLEKIFRPIIKFSFRVFEPTLPIFLTYFLDKKLRRWEQEDLIESSKVRVERPKRYHYNINLDFSLTEKQARERFSDVVIKLPKLGRGF